jgi:WD40 repeat protein/transcriptional regulator with XRE-family HTH domain
MKQAKEGGDMSDQTLSLDSFETFGDLLKYLRRREHLTQLELSIVVGYSEAQIGRLEKNQRRPDLTSLRALFIPALHLEDEPELIARFLELAQSSRQEDAPVPGIAPYKGLLFFDELDAELFFGREALTAHLVERVSDLSLNSSLRFLAVVGASGSGKSSLARAGLAVALRQAGWDVHVFTPGADPCQALETQLELDHGQGASGRVLLLVDQFEETFTLCHNESERIRFTENLLCLAQDPSQNTTVVIALRADFYSHCAQYPLLREAVAAKQEYIGQMTARELRHAIEEPARRGGWVFEPGLVDVLLQDIGAHDSQEPEPGGLPLLSHALLATWEHRCGRTLTLKGYRASGGVRGAIAETAENVFHDQLNQAQQELAREVFLRLTELGEGTEDTRRRAALNELVAQSAEATQLRTVLNTLADARLITLNEDSAEVAHEALIREWQRLHEWLTQDREGLLLHRHLTEAAHEWEERGSDPAELYRGARLAQVREWVSVNEEKLNGLEQAFLTASIEQEKQDTLEREAQRQRELEAAQKLAKTERDRAEEQTKSATRLRTRNRVITAVGSIAVILAIVAGLFGSRANQAAKTSFSRELAAASISSLDEDPERSILLALQAETTTDTPEAENALHRSILASHTVLVVHNGAPVWDVTFSPDGKRFATASQDKTAKVWDAKTGQLLLTLSGHTDQVAGIVYSPDGKQIATTSDDHTAKIWDANTGQLLLTLTGHTDGVGPVAFSPDGTRLVTTSLDKTAMVWDALTGEELLTYTQPSTQRGFYYSGVAFNSDGHRIAASGNDGIVRIWDVTTGKESLSLSVASEFGAGQPHVAFSPDGKRLALVSDGINPVKIWDATTGEVLLSGNLGHSVPPIDIAFSPDGKLAVTGGNDQKANVWDTTTGRILYTLSGHTQAIIGVAFSPDGTHVATASSDGTARIWDVMPAKEILFIPFANPEINWNGWLSYNADGTRILTDYTDSNARIWDAVSGKELMQLGGFTADTGAVQPSYSPDGKLVAAGNGDIKIFVWDAQTGEQRTTLVGFEGWARHTAFSPDGTRLASANSNDGTKASKIVGTVTIWDLASAKVLLTMQTSPHGTTSVAYSPDGKYLISGDWDANGIIWDANTGKKLFTLPDQSWVTAVSYSPDGKLVATGDFNGIVTLWNASSGEKLVTLKGHNGFVNAVPFSPDGKLIATASKDGTARVWDVATGENLLTVPVDAQGLGGVSFSPDGKRLAIGGYSGIYILALPIEDVVELAKSRVTRLLRTEECKQYLHVLSCPAQ